MRRISPTRAARNLTFGVVVLVLCAIGAQQLIADKSQDGTTAKLVCQMISRFHVSQKKIDDAISQQLFDKFVKDLDPQKLYFTKADIDKYMAYRNNLDDLLKNGNVDFAYEFFALYLQRLDQRVELAQQLIDEEHDFTVDESMTIDGDTLNWAANEGEIRDRWRKRIKYDLVSLKLDDTPLAEARERLHKRYHILKETMHQTEDFETLEMFLSALTHCFDPHSTYMSPQSLEEFQIVMRLSLQGIGAQLTFKDGMTEVNKVMQGGAAEKDGRLAAGDKIIAVSQDGADWVDVIEMKLSKVVRLIRGKAGTTVHLRVVKGEGGQTVDYALVRQNIELNEQAVQGKIIDASQWVQGASGRVGVINIPSFYRDFSGAQAGKEDFRSTSRDVLKVLDDFQQQGGVDAIVIDLRSNGGGALNEAIEVSGLFVGEGPIVQVKDLNGDVRSHDYDLTDRPVYTGPLMVVTNRLAASASEIFAGAIKDYGRGIIVGDTTTHGKGTVQNVVEVGRNLFNFGNSPGLGALKVTINQFYRVNGDSTQREGVKSQVIIPSAIDHMELGEAFLDNALAFDQVQPVDHTDYGMFTPKMIQALQTASKDRLSASEYFRKLEQRMARYEERKNRKQISLNEATLRKEREEGASEEKALEEEMEKEEDGVEDPFRDNPYNRELLNITLDYVKQLAALKTAGTSN